ncbi:MAG: transcriptional regulator [Pseudomonadota bacterium]
MTNEAIPVPTAIFHQPVRTRLALILFLGEASFSELKGRLEITDGNLDAHLKKLSAAGYLHSRMVLEGRPHTVYRLSESGTKAFRKYLDDIAKIGKIAHFHDWTGRS